MIRLLLTISIITGSLAHSTAQWKISSSGPEAYLLEVDFPTPDAAYASAEMGMLFKSTDKGVSWDTLYNFGPFTSLSDLQFMNADTGFVRIYNQLMRTFDGGQSWTSPTVNWPHQPRSFLKVKVTSRRLYASYVENDTAYLMKSDDFGTSLSEIHRHYEPNAQALVFSFPDTLQGFIINPNELEEVLKTTDGGQTFDTLSITSGPMVLQQEFDYTDTLHGYHYGNRFGQFVPTQPHPTRTWNTGTFYLPIDLDGFGVLPVLDLDWNTSRLYAGSLYGKIFYSEDHGRNWTAQNTPVSDPVYSIAFLNEDEAIAVSGKKILYTSNAGNIGMKEIGDESSEIKIFPNPAQDFLKVETSPELQIKQISLLDLTGKKLTEFDKTGNFLNLQGLSQGQYILQFTTSTGVVNKKVVVF